MDMKGKHVPLTDEQKALAAIMIKYWTQFARSGDPNGEGTPPWPRFAADDARLRVQILAPGSKGVGPASDAAVAHRCKFWERFVD
jgi:para-nitrobenzyl esterase